MEDVKSQLGRRHGPVTVPRRLLAPVDRLCFASTGDSGGEPSPNGSCPTSPSHAVQAAYWLAHRAPLYDGTDPR